MVIWAKKVNEVFERLSSSGNVRFTQTWWGLPQSDLAQKYFQVTALGLFFNPGMGRNVTQEVVYLDLSSPHQHPPANKGTGF